MGGGEMSNLKVNLSNHFIPKKPHKSLMLGVLTLGCAHGCWPQRRGADAAGEGRAVHSNQLPGAAAHPQTTCGELLPWAHGKQGVDPGDTAITGAWTHPGVMGRSAQKCREYSHQPSAKDL